MTKSKRNNKIRKVIGSLLIVFGLALTFGRIIYNFTSNKVDDIKVETFFEGKHPTGNVIHSNNQNNSSSYKKANYKNGYYAVLEIPAISLKRGLVYKNSKANNVNKNIKTLKSSDTPDIVGGTLLLASHSGNSHVAYFKNLYKLNKNDLINVYYDGYKYEYKITDIYSQDKTGVITYMYKNTSMIVLTTCNQQEKGKQIIVIGTLDNKSKY